MPQFAVDNPFLETLGVSVAQWREGYAELLMPIDGSKLNRQGVLQGGAIATLLDAAAGYAGLYADPDAPKRHGFTLSLTTNYLDKGWPVRARQGVSGAWRTLDFLCARRGMGGRSLADRQRARDVQIFAIGLELFGFRIDWLEQKNPPTMRLAGLYRQTLVSD